VQTPRINVGPVSFFLNAATILVPGVGYSKRIRRIKFFSLVCAIKKKKVQCNNTVVVKRRRFPQEGTAVVREETDRRGVLQRVKRDCSKVIASNQKDFNKHLSFSELCRDF